MFSLECINRIKGLRLYIGLLSIGAFIAPPIVKDREYGASDGFRYPIAVYYFPLRANSSEPITERSIETKYDLTGLLKTDVPDLLEVVRKAEEPSNSIDPNQISLKFRTDKSTILVDLYGNVREGGKFHRLSQASMRDLKRRILSAVPTD